MKLGILNKKLSWNTNFPSCQVYLQYCSFNNINCQSTVFKGTLYELYVKDILTKFFNCDLIRNGGAYDNGIDLLGRWDLSNINEPNEVIDKSTSSKPAAKLPLNSLLRSNFNLANVNVLVQCKNVNKKIDARIMRELSGIYDFHVNAKGKFSNVIFLFSPHTLTKQGLTQMDKSNFPLVHWQLSPLKLIDQPGVNRDQLEESQLEQNRQERNNHSGHFNLSNWDHGPLNQIYLNPFARKCLSGMNIEMKLELLRREMNLHLIES